MAQTDLRFEVWKVIHPEKWAEAKRLWDNKVNQNIQPRFLAGNNILRAAGFEHMIGTAHKQWLEERDSDEIPEEIVAWIKRRNKE